MKAVWVKVASGWGAWDWAGVAWEAGAAAWSKKKKTRANLHAVNVCSDPAAVRPRWLPPTASMHVGGRSGRAADGW